jgi:S-adenosylmethionine synthetase
MNVEEFENRAKSIVDDELNNIKTMLKKIPDPQAKDEADRLGLSTIDVDIKNNPLAYNVLKNFVANMILEQVSDKSKKINYEEIIKEIVTHIMTFCIGYKAALIKPRL